MNDHLRVVISGTFLAAIQHPNSVVEVSAGIFYDEDIVLCFRKSKAKYDYLSYKYEFPGGKLESGESPKEALVRELDEELSLSVDSLEFLGTVDHSYPDFDVRLHFFLIPYSGIEPTLKEHTAADWIPIDKLDSIDWAEADRLILPELRDRLA